MSQLFSHYFFTEMSLFSHMFGWNVASDVWFESYKDQITKTPKSKRQSWLLLRSRTKPADWTGVIFSANSQGFSEFNANGNMETNLGKFTMKKNPPWIVSCILPWNGHFHCFIGTQNRVSLTNTPCSKLFWPLPPTEVAWKSTRSLRLQSKREL